MTYFSNVTLQFRARMREFNISHDENEVDVRHSVAATDVIIPIFDPCLDVGWSGAVWYYCIYHNHTIQPIFRLGYANFFGIVIVACMCFGLFDVARCEGRAAPASSVGHSTLSFRDKKK
ncbi:hypothetical protein EDB85DRAFT_2001012, partial [Lactarius pseudohatsudake]